MLCYKENIPQEIKSGKPYRLKTKPKIDISLLI